MLLRSQTMSSSQALSSGHAGSSLEAEPYENEGFAAGVAPLGVQHHAETRALDDPPRVSRPAMCRHLLQCMTLQTRPCAHHSHLCHCCTLRSACISLLAGQGEVRRVRRTSCQRDVTQWPSGHSLCDRRCKHTLTRPRTCGTASPTCDQRDGAGTPEPAVCVCRPLTVCRQRNVSNSIHWPQATSKPHG